MWWLDTVRVESFFSRSHFLELGLDAGSTLVKDGAQRIILGFQNPITIFVSLGSDGW